MVARTVEKITAASRVQVKEDTRHDNDLLRQAGLEEVEAVGDLFRQTLEVQPEVESTVWHILDHKAHVAKTLHHVVSLLLDLAL